MKRLYKACEIDSDGAMFVSIKWLTTEESARRFFAKFTMATVLVGNGGLILASR